MDQPVSAFAISPGSSAAGKALAEKALGRDWLKEYRKEPRRPPALWVSLWLCFSSAAFPATLSVQPSERRMRTCRGESIYGKSYQGRMLIIPHRMADYRTLLVLVCIAGGLSHSTLSYAADFVIHISVDGLRPDYMQAVVDAGNAPNFKRFQDEGAWTNNARTDYTHTITLPNHTSMLTARPVSQPAGMPNTTHHGYTHNSDPDPSWTLHNQGNLNAPYKASTFDVAHDAGLSTALFASKTKFVIYDQSYNSATGAPHPNGRDKIDTFYGPGSNTAMQSQLLPSLAANHYNYTFVHYASLDNAGHGSGWGSDVYNTAVTTVDGYLGSLFNLVTTDATFAGRTAIILSADHGGSGTGHGDATNPQHYTIPFYAWGAGVVPGDLYALNSDTRTNPGASRVSYTASGQPIRNGDGGNLALSLLGLGPIPGSLINSAQDLRVAPGGDPADINGDDVVNLDDYHLLLMNMGLHLNGPIPPSSGDLNFDRKIDTQDFGLFKDGYPGGSAALEAALAGAFVPEPSLAMVALPLVALAARRVARARSRSVLKRSAS